MASKGAVDLDALSTRQIRDLVHELEVHKVELQIQNEQLIESRLAAEESKERYRELYESAPIGFLTLDSRGTIVESNLSFASLLGTPRSRLIGRKLSSFVAPRFQDRWHLERRAMEQGPVRRTFELELTRRDGTGLHAQIVGAAGETEPAAGDPLRLAVLDVTELRKAERALRAAASEMSLTEQRERRKLASDLHDDAGQLLSLALLKLRVLGASASGSYVGAIREIEEILAQTSKRISSLSFELSPPLLHDLGLLAAAQWLAEDLESRYGLVVTICEVEELQLGEAESITLYRAMRELLINVIKHAGVGTARVWIWRDGGMGRVTVEDSGVGFGPKTAGHGFGLLALRERLGELGGSLEIGAAPGGGTSAVASVPLSSAAARSAAEEVAPKAAPRPKRASARADRSERV